MTNMATFGKRNGRIFAQVAIKGVRNNKSVDTKQEAMLWAGTTEAAILSGESV